MTVKFGAGRLVTFALYADISNDGWIAAQGAGSNVANLGAWISAALVGAGGGTPRVAPVEVTPRPNSGADATLSARVSWTPARDVLSSTLETNILAALNRGMPAGVRWVEHVNATSYLATAVAAGPFTVLLAPVALIAGAASLASDDIREGIASRYRSVAGHVIDESSIRPGESREPAPASSSVIGQALSVGTGGPVQSTDPTRAGRTPLGRVSDSVPSLAPPVWLVGTGLAIAGLIALVGVGYAARGAAQLLRETK